MMLPWSEFTRLVQRNKKPWAQIKYYPSEKLDHQERTFSIYDFTLPRRQGTVVGGDGFSSPEKCWERDSFVCNVSVFDNYIPYENRIDVWDDVRKEFVVRPARGLKEALSMLVGQGVVERTNEVDNAIKQRF